MSTTKRALRRRLAREESAILARLAAAVEPNLAGPMLGRANIGYELSERSRGVAHGGMGMIARVVAEAWPPRSTPRCDCSRCTGPTTSPITC